METHPVSSADEATPLCEICGEPIGMFPSNGVLSMSGQWMPSTEFGCAIFVLDPKTDLQVVQLPNGQLAVIPGHQKPNIHSHHSCFDAMMDEYLYGDVDNYDYAGDDNFPDFPEE